MDILFQGRNKRPLVIEEPCDTARCVGPSQVKNW